MDDTIKKDPDNFQKIDGRLFRIEDQKKRLYIRDHLEQMKILKSIHEYGHFEIKKNYVSVSGGQIGRLIWNSFWKKARDEQFKKRQPLFYDEKGLARCLTRLEHAELEYDEKYPIVLPTCEFTKTFLEYLHQNDKHSSVAYSIWSNWHRKSTWFPLCRNYWKTKSFRTLARRINQKKNSWTI